MKKSPVQPLFTLADAEPRRKRIVMKLFMAVLVALAVLAAFQIVPLGATTFSDRRARHNIGKAEKDVADGLPVEAAALYERVAGTESVSLTLRIQALERLVPLYNGPLKNPAAGQATQGRLDLFRPRRPSRRPGGGETGRAGGATRAPPPSSRASAMKTSPRPVIYLKPVYGNRPPRAGIQNFCRRYFDMVLRGGQWPAGAALPKRATRARPAAQPLVSMNKAMAIEIINQLKPRGEQG